jgi:hypothetical protein
MALCAKILCLTGCVSTGERPAPSPASETLIIRSISGLRGGPLPWELRFEAGPTCDRLQATYSRGKVTDIRKVLSPVPLAAVFQDIQHYELPVHDGSDADASLIEVTYVNKSMSGVYDIRGWGYDRLQRSPYLSNLLWQVLPYQLKGSREGYYTLADLENVPPQSKPKEERLTVTFQSDSASKPWQIILQTLEGGESATLINYAGDAGKAGGVELFFSEESVFREVASTDVCLPGHSGVEDTLIVEYVARGRIMRFTASGGQREIAFLLHSCPRLSGLLWQIAPVESRLKQFGY